jgi:hypothetical protein
MVENFLEIVPGLQGVQLASGLTHLQFQEGNFVMQSSLHEIPGHAVEQQAMDDPRQCH